MLTIPRRIETERLVLRPWVRDDAPRMKAAIDANLDHLRAWMPWAMAEPSPLEDIEDRIAQFDADFGACVDWTFAIFARDDRTVIGGTGLHARLGPGALEIGYWIQRSLEGRGFATEAAGALTHIGFAQPGIERMEIRCDPRNVRSAAVPRRLGYRHVTTLVGDTVTPDGKPRDTMVWQLTTGEFFAAHQLRNPNEPE